MSLFIFTDGARKGRDGGWAFVAVRDGIEVHRDSGREIHTSSSRMELMAILKAIAWAASVDDNVIIVTDSQVSIHVLTKARPPGATGQPKNNDLIRQCKQLMSGCRVTFEWVRGHSGHEWNEFADRLATYALGGVPAAEVYMARKLVRKLGKPFVRQRRVSRLSEA